MGASASSVERGNVDNAAAADESIVGRSLIDRFDPYQRLLMFAQARPFIVA